MCSEVAVNGADETVTKVALDRIVAIATSLGGDFW